MNLSKAKQAKSRAVAGRWIRDIPLGDTGLTIDFRARRLSNPDADRVRFELAAAARSAGEAAAEGKGEGDVAPTVILSDAERRSMLVQVLARAVITDWSVEDDDGQVHYTSEAAIDAFNDDVIGEDMVGAALIAAAQAERLGFAEAEEDAKN